MRELNVRRRQADTTDVIQYREVQWTLMMSAAADDDEDLVVTELQPSAWVSPGGRGCRERDGDGGGRMQRTGGPDHTQSHR